MSNNQNQERLARLCKTLGHPHRLAILAKLVVCCRPGTKWEVATSDVARVGWLGQGLGIAPSTVSHHLKELVQAGLIKTERRGKMVVAWVDPETLRFAADYFSALVGGIPEEKGGVPMDERHQQIKETVQVKYAAVAQQGPQGGCGCGCGGSTRPSPVDISAAVGYSTEELAAVPDGANLGLGCGNPQAIAGLRPGEVVLDLGSGGGFDAFLAARQVGPAGRVIGVDMTPEMIDLARRNAAKAGLENVVFEQGEIERLPLAAESVDVVMSNCVINLSPDKASVYREIFRVLKPNGRLAISDVVALAPLPAEMKQDLALWAACGAGAMVKADLEALLAQVGFVEVQLQVNPASADYIRQWVPGRGLENYLAAASLTARKPA